MLGRFLNPAIAVLIDDRVDTPMNCSPLTNRNLICFAPQNSSIFIGKDSRLWDRNLFFADFSIVTPYPVRFLQASAALLIRPFSLGIPRSIQ